MAAAPAQFRVEAIKDARQDIAVGNELLGFVEWPPCALPLRLFLPVGELRTVTQGIKLRLRFTAILGAPFVHA
jgi:hypothetical protein